MDSGMFKSVKFWVAVAALAALVWWAFGDSPDSGPYEAAVMPVPESDFTAVAKGKVDVEGGVIEVAARSHGVFRDIYVEEGDRVEAGQVLAVQEDDEQRIRLRQAQAQLQSANAGLERLQVRLDIARREHNRLEPLVDIDAASSQELDRAKDDLRQLEVDIEAQKASVLQSEANLESAQFSLEQRTVRAPVAGRIVEAKARPGVGASTFQVSTAFTLMPDAQKIVRADLDQAFVGKVRVGQQASIAPDSDPQTTYDGEVLRVGEIFGRRTTQDSPGSGGGSDYVIEVVVGAGDMPLLIGQRVLVRFLKG